MNDDLDSKIQRVALGNKKTAIAVVRSVRKNASYISRVKWRLVE